MDVHDGTKDETELSKDQKENALKEVPSILEMFSQAFFIGGYFVGPQFSMKKYQNFIQRNIEEDLPPSRRFAFKRFGIGVCYMAGHLIGDKFVSFYIKKSQNIFNVKKFVKVRFDSIKTVQISLHFDEFFFFKILI